MRFRILVFCLLLSLNLTSQSLDKAQQTLRTVGNSGQDYYSIISLGNENFNNRKFILAEKNYLTALQLLEGDSIEKQLHPDNYAAGKLILYKNLLEVNEGLKDYTDINKYKLKIHKLEEAISNDNNIDISSYFEKTAKDFYKRKQYKEAYENIKLGVLSCKNDERKKGLKTFKDEIEAIIKFNKKEYKLALDLCNKVLSIKKENPPVLDLRGRVSYALGNKIGACDDWKNAGSLDYPISRLRINRYCK